MNLTDTHCHLDVEQYDSDRLNVIARAKEAGVSRILIPGLSVNSSRAAVQLAESQPLLFAAAGVHPTETINFSAQVLSEIKEIAAHPKVKAIGEIGLDYYWDSAPHEIQRQALNQQLNLASELNLPVVIHLREAKDAEDGPCASDLMTILQEWVKKLRGSQHPLAENPGVLHSFSGSLTTAQAAIQLNFYIGITGPITYKNAEQKRAILKHLPLEKILIETDGPYLAPVPQRGKRNEPSFVKHITDKIAETLNINPEQIAEITSQNAARLFSWGGPI